MRLNLLIVICLLSACVAVRAEDNVGTESPFVFGFGARELALGGSNLSTADFAFASFWNSSRLTSTDRFTAAAFHGSLYESDVMYQYVGLAVPTLDFGSLGLGVARLGVGGIEQRDDHNTLWGSTTENRLALYLAYARRIAGYDIGVCMSLEHHSLADYSSTSSPGVNFSISRELASSIGWLYKPTVSLSGSNLVRPGIDLANTTVRYPAQYDGSFSVELRPGEKSIQSLSLSALISRAADRQDNVSFGVEYNLGNTLFLRGGHREDHLSAGLGLRYRAIRFDYAAVGRDLGTLHFFTVSTSIGKTVGERRRIREEKRESEFDTYFSDRVLESNRKLADSLNTLGETLLQASDYQGALERFDRALFLTRSASLDTAAILANLMQAQSGIAQQVRQAQFTEYLDSARAKFSASDYVGVRYFADRALEAIPGSEDARALRDRADAELAKISERENLLKQRIAVVDSLLDFGEIDQGLLQARALSQFAGDNAEVKAALRRAEFEKVRSNASRHYSVGSWSSALAALDSALVLFPGHQWCSDLRTRIAKAQKARTPAPIQVDTPPARKQTLTPELTEQVESSYEEGQAAFRQGELDRAIAEWESVERLAPDFQRVHEYLLRAYRLAGVEYYAQNKLREAVETFTKASRLDPANEEIQRYLERASSELKRLQEFSYDQ